MAFRLRAGDVADGNICALRALGDLYRLQGKDDLANQYQQQSLVICAEHGLNASDYVP